MEEPESQPKPKVQRKESKKSIHKKLQREKAYKSHAARRRTKELLEIQAELDQSMEEEQPCASGSASLDNDNSANTTILDASFLSDTDESDYVPTPQRKASKAGKTIGNYNFALYHCK